MVFRTKTKKTLWLAGNYHNDKESYLSILLMSILYSKRDIFNTHLDQQMRHFRKPNHK